MKRRLVTAMTVSLGLAACVLAAQDQPAQLQPRPPAKRARTEATSTSEGEKRFRINCGRCHNPPEDISPREARAVVRHMRVRAMLTADDEKFILEYLAP